MPSKPSKPFEIATIGGGIAGLTLALGLARRNIPFQIYEKAHQFSEIGYGVSISVNAARALSLLDEATPYFDPATDDGGRSDKKMGPIYAAMDECATRNSWPERQSVWFEFVDGMDQIPPSEVKQAFSIVDPTGYRQSAHFGKNFIDATENAETGRLTLHFKDGTTAEADAIIGCDGIKSRARAIVVGEGNPALLPTYTHKFVYRGMIPVADAVKALGDEKARNAFIWMGPDRHVLTFMVDHGETLNLVAFVTTDEPWPDPDHLTLPGTREDAVKAFADFNPGICHLIKLTKDHPDRWALFDLGDHPLATFYKGRICLTGDAANATTPHHGAGAGFCIEDSTVLVSLLEDESVKEVKDLEHVFATFDNARRERANWLVQSSRRSGDMYQYRSEYGDDAAKIGAEMKRRFAHIWTYDVGMAVEEARADLRLRLGRA